MSFEEAVKRYHDVKHLHKHGVWPLSVKPNWIKEMQQEISSQINIPINHIVNFAMEEICDVFYTKLKAVSKRQRLTGD